MWEKWQACVAWHAADASEKGFKAYLSSESFNEGWGSEGVALGHSFFNLFHFILLSAPVKRGSSLSQMTGT